MYAAALQHAQCINLDVQVAYGKPRTAEHSSIPARPKAAHTAKISEVAPTDMPVQRHSSSLPSDGYC